MLQGEVSILAHSLGSVLCPDSKSHPFSSLPLSTRTLNPNS